jgi:hypothetical protein
MKQNDSEQLKKKHSDNYVIEKLSEDLSAANAIIDQVIISKQSDVVNKLLKFTVVDENRTLFSVPSPGRRRDKAEELLLVQPGTSQSASQCPFLPNESGIAILSVTVLFIPTR